MLLLICFLRCLSTLPLNSKKECFRRLKPFSTSRINFYLFSNSQGVVEKFSMNCIVTWIMYNSYLSVTTSLNKQNFSIFYITCTCVWFSFTTISEQLLNIQYVLAPDRFSYAKPSQKCLPCYCGCPVLAVNGSCYQPY